LYLWVVVLSIFIFIFMFFAQIKAIDTNAADKQASKYSF